nr:transcription factor ILR3 [Tanacetum cinerariifolium]
MIFRGVNRSWGSKLPHGNALESHIWHELVSTNRGGAWTWDRYYRMCRRVESGWRTTKVYEKHISRLFLKKKILRFFVNCKGFSDSNANSDATKENESRKRAHPGSCSGTKACREKKRRDKLNERFQELNEILDPGRSAKTDKTVILADAIRKITHLRNEATNLKDSSQELLVKINELKVIYHRNTFCLLPFCLSDNI